MSARTARWIAWSLVALYITLATIGLTLQFLSDTSYTNIAFPVLLIIIPLVGIWPAIGALIISRHPRHPVGWLLSVGLLSPAFDMFFSGYVSYGADVYAGTLPAMTVALIWLMWSGFPFATTAFTLMVLLFPDGRPLSPFWRKMAWTAMGALLLYLPIQAVHPGAVDPFTGILLDNPLGVSSSLWTILEPLWLVGLAMLALCNLAAVFSLIVRLRGARGDKRQQIKWLVLPAAGYFTSIPFTIFALVETNTRVIFLAIALVLCSVAAMVIATALAIFKYRLYDIDPIINRALVYGALTASLVAIYALLVGALGVLFQSQGNLILALLATGIVAVLFQPLRERLQRGINRLTYGQRDEPFEALTRLGGRLEDIFSPEMVYPTIVETVAQALKLPYAAIAVKRGEGFEIAKAYGDANQGLQAYRLVHQGELVGQLLVGRRTPDENFTVADDRLLRSFAQQVGAAVYAVQLTADLQRSRQQLVTAREEERRRLRRDLHDGLGPALASVVWQADSARDMVYSDPQEAVKLLESSIEQAQAALADIRRLVYGLRPPALDELGLIGALEQEARKHHGTAVTIEAPEPLPSLPAAVEVAAYRIVREALKNAIEHGSAANCVVHLAVDGRFCFTIHDDGQGLPETLTPGVGLVSMRERAQELGGELTIRPRRAGGTAVEVQLPLE